MAEAPNWSELEGFQETITHHEFVELLDTVYASDGAWKSFVTLSADSAAILTTGSDAHFTLRFAANAESAKTPPRYWRPAAKFSDASATRPLEGVAIALDPGHIGGRWAIMEERWFKPRKDATPITEGDMTLWVAKRLAPKLRALGADVSYVRNTTEPVTIQRPSDLREIAMTELQRQGIRFTREDYTGMDDPLKPNSIKWQSELLFYRVSEIRERAKKVNQELKPDLVLCLHFNAEEWGDPKQPRLVEKNHLHLLVNGCYNTTELAVEDVRFDMLMKLLSRCYAEELPVAETVADFMAGESRLPPYQYTRPNARRVGNNPYIWARNLLANRLYRCPVVYIEPYVMNSEAIANRLKLGDMGDYDGERLVNGEWRKNIYREYADAVADGLAAYYRAVRTEKK